MHRLVGLLFRWQVGTMKNYLVPCQQLHSLRRFSQALPCVV